MIMIQISVIDYVKLFSILFIITFQWQTINCLRLLSKRDWQSSLPIPLPKPGEYSEGYITQFMNHNNTIDDISSIDLDDDTSINIHYDQLNLTVSNRCIPGTEYQCPDNFECRSLPHFDPHFNVCVQVDCRKNCINNEEIHCPADSEIVQQMIEINGEKCCLHFCNCDETKCTVNKCPGSRPALLVKAAKIPGQCCDRIECNAYTPKKCFDINGDQFDSGESWIRYGDCHRCKCIDGVRKCEFINNCPFKCLPANHTERLDSEQCCPPCKACLDNRGIKHEDSSTWIDDCQRCECKNGQIICNLPYGGQQFCDRPCTENELRDWQIDKCCDKCKCTLNCPFGFQINSTDNHSQLCKCRENITDTKQIANKSIENHQRSSKKVNENFDHLIVLCLIFSALMFIISVYCSYRYCVYKKKLKNSPNKIVSNKIDENLMEKFLDNNNHHHETNLEEIEESSHIINGNNNYNNNNNNNNAHNT